MAGVEGFRLLLTVPLHGDADNGAVEDKKEEERDCDEANVTVHECTQCRFEDERRQRQKRWMPPASNLSKYLLQSSNNITNRQLSLCPPTPVQICTNLCARHCPPPPAQSFQRSLPHPRRPQQAERIQPTFEQKRRGLFLRTVTTRFCLPQAVSPVLVHLPSVFSRPTPTSSEH